MQFVGQVQHIGPRVTVGVKNTPKQFIVIYDGSVDSGVRNIPGVVIDFFGQKVEALKMLSVGDTVEVDCDITVNSYNDKWYNNISGSSLLIKEYTKKEVDDDLPLKNRENKCCMHKIEYEIGQNHKLWKIPLILF